ncbi:MAG: hydrogenase expression/formation protein HypE [Kiritimatiellia bacterium]|jgi:hydrogenase expression/formation protein HypE|nr:hydrogenase expression/formation protein HypE [Kiritimatiellia bacterium]MDP6847548.1 hydrogenase expression/formation protein HypE [Kiritimatiellia bacterium]
MNLDTDNLVQLAHGGGGRLSRELIDKEIVSRFGGGALEGLPDAATLPRCDGEIVFSTDSFVVQPLFFPGGNIGDLAVHGTVNDISVCGATPRWLSMGLIIEEGLAISKLGEILDSVQVAANDCGVSIVTGDTKVVARGQCDGLYINTAGIGIKMPGFELGPHRITRGDHVLVSGTIAEHGLAVLASRKSIEIENGPLSDTGPVHRLVAACSDIAEDIHAMRDPTRGGLSAVLNELVEGTNTGIMLDETQIPLSQGGKAVVELLGLDPLHVASEGRMALMCSPDVSDDILARWHDMPEGESACRIGEVTDEAERVVMNTLIGGHRLVDIPRGELLPRIC